MAGIGLDSLACEVFADSGDIALKDQEGIAVLPGIDGLGKIYQVDLAMPV